MITKDKCREEIERLLQGPMTRENVDTLVGLYLICDRMHDDDDFLEDREEHKKLDRRTAEKWAAHMENEDGSRGPHWSMSQTEQVRALKGVTATAEEWFAIMNSVYSDYYAVAKKYGLAGNTDFWADMATAWLMDADAVKGKADAYYRYIVKH